MSISMIATHGQDRALITNQPLPQSYQIVREGDVKVLKMVDGFDFNSLANAIDCLPAGITIMDKEAVMLYFNDYCTRLLDRKPEYLVSIRK